MSWRGSVSMGRLVSRSSSGLAAEVMFSVLMRQSLARLILGRMMSEPWLSLTEHLDRAADDGDFSGTVLVTAGEETLLHACHGIANRAAGVPVMRRTRFGVASLSKMFTAVAVLAALDDAGVGVDERVVDLLPEWRRPRTLDPGVTVHHLLTHTSGIGDYAEEDENLPGYVPDYAALWRELPNYRMRRPDDFLPLYSGLPAVSTPGEAYHYCNAGFVLLGALLEELTGEEFSEAVAARVLRPAGTPQRVLRPRRGPPGHRAGVLPARTPRWAVALQHLLDPGRRGRRRRRLRHGAGPGPLPPGRRLGRTAGRRHDGADAHPARPGGGGPLDGARGLPAGGWQLRVRRG